MPRSGSLWAGIIIIGSALAFAGCSGGGSSTASGATAAASTSGTGGSGVAASATNVATPVSAEPLPSGPQGGPRAKGIDVSKWQGTIDWARVAGSGIRFAVARVSDGLHTHDATFAPNWRGMKRNGLVRGVYQYFRAGQDAVQQADYLVQQVNALGGFGPGDLPPMLDLETLDGQTKATVRAQMDRWIARIEARTGLHPLIYTSPSFWGSLGASSHGDDNDLWIAHWGVTSPRIPSGWRAWTFWQTSSSGSVPGIAGRVDTDLFNGSVADLKAYAQARVRPGFYRGLAIDSTGRGYWLGAVDGGVFPYGDATYRGTIGGRRHPEPILGIVRTPTGFGYWLFRADGKVFGFGDATEQGDLAGRTLAAPVGAMAATASGQGYWLITRDGHVHPFGDAQDYGQPAATQTSPTVAAAATPSGRGYWTASADGTVFGFGDAVPQGDLTGRGITSPVVGIAATPTGRGYWLVQSDGTLSAFGDAPALVYTGSRTLNAPVVGIAPSLTGQGCWLVATDGTVLAFGDAVDAGARAR